MLVPCSKLLTLILADSFSSISVSLSNSLVSLEISISSRLGVVTQAESLWARARARARAMNMCPLCVLFGIHSSLFASLLQPIYPHAITAICRGRITY